MFLRDLPPGVVLYVVAVWTVAIAFICWALIVLAPPLLKELKAWSAEAFRSRRANVVSIEERRRRRSLDAIVGRSEVR